MLRLGVPVLLVMAGLVGPHNPIDTIGRAKFVRAIQTREGEAAATVCLPADTEDQVAGYLEDLPRVLRELERQGARALVYDLTQLPSEAQGRTTLPVVVTGGVAAPTYSTVQVAARGDKVRSVGVPVVLGVHASGLPVAVAALGLHRGEVAALVEEPVGAQAALEVGDQQWPVFGTLLFMPYLIPFLHWEHTETWEGVVGRTVFIGACRLDRELTRYGRQPGTVAHGELFETLRDAVIVRPLHWSLDPLLALGVYGLAAGARATFPARARWAVVAVGGAAIAVVLALSLHGVWLSLTGVVFAVGLALRSTASRRAPPRVDRRDETGVLPLG